MRHKTLLYILILIYITIKLIKKLKLKENFNLYSFKCIDNNSYSYLKEIIKIKNNLENDRFIMTKSFECEKLLQIYDIITCDLQKNELSSLNITDYLKIEYDPNKLNYINNIFSLIEIESKTLINTISNLSDDITLTRYINPNINIIQNLKNEFIMKFI